MNDQLFEIIYGVLYFVMAIVRKVGVRNYRREPVKEKKRDWVDIGILAVAGLAMALPVLYILSDSLSFADYYLPEWIKILGIPVMILAIWLLWRSHYDLGRNWIEYIGIRKDHKLITTGIFKYIRHPMYAAHIVWGIAQIMMLSNWLVGPSILIVFLMVYFYRVKKEEKVLIDEFGDEYKKYIQKTGRLLPRKL